MKYGNKPTMVDGIKFASQAEARRYGELKLLQKAGRITGLELQPAFQLAPSVKFEGAKRAKPAMVFQADFAYMENGKRVVEDVKGVQTQVFRIKRHLMAWLHKIDVRVVA